jgi:hypothetical protein
VIALIIVLPSLGFLFYVFKLKKVTLDVAQNPAAIGVHTGELLRQ